MYGALTSTNHSVRIVHNVSVAIESPPRAGRPRSERARLAILEAAADRLVEDGLAGATMESVAARAGVSKVTIYKWWPSRGALAIDAYFHRYSHMDTFEDTGDLARDLCAQITALVRAFRGRAGEVMAELIGQAQTDPLLGEVLRERWLAPRREAATAVLRRAMERGEIRSDLDLGVVLDQLYAPIYYRLAMGHAALDDDLAGRLVHGVLEGALSREVRAAGAGGGQAFQAEVT
jgi:AcrR family transcriptional regulator